MTTAIPTDADLDGADNAADEFFKRLVKDAPEPSNDDEGEDTEDTTNEEAEETDSDEDSPESDDDGDEGGEGSDDTDEAEDDAEPETEEDDDSDTDRRKTVIDSEDAVVKIKVDGEEIEASIKDLKRLYGQDRCAPSLPPSSA